MTDAARLPSSLDFRQLFDSSSNAYMVVDADLRYAYANPTYLEVTGSTLSDLVGNHVLTRFPHDEENPENENARILRSSFKKVFATGERDFIALIRYRVPRAPGAPPEERYWSATHTPLIGADGRVEFLLQHTVDVTELQRLRQVAEIAGTDRTLAQLEAGVLGRAELVQQAKDQLAERVERLHTLFEQAPGLVAVLRGPEHVFELTNAAYRTLIGGRDVVGKPVKDALPEIAGQGFYELLDRVYASGEVFVGRAVTVFLERAPGARPEPAILDFVYQPILGPDGKSTGILVQGNDITQKAKTEVERERLLEERERLLEAERAARSEAERVNRTKDEMIATVSHELRTPLTAISGWVQLLRASELSEDRRKHALETMDRNARALGQLVDDILDINRIMSGKLKLEVEPMYVMQPAEAAIEAVRPSAVAKEVRIQSTLDSQAIVMGDAARLQQIVWNLLSNAVKFTPRGGRVQVTVERRDSSVAIVVADDGQGMAPDFIPHAFERFSQWDGGSRRRHGGLGLGLAIVKHLVEQHGGTISAESAGIALGATFTVLLPVALSRRAVRATVSAATFEAPPELAGLRILVVEDEPDTRELLRELLVNCDANVELASSVSDGLAAFTRETPDLVISDIGMPEEDGYGFIKQLRALPNGLRVPAIALTAFARTEDRTAILRAGFRAHVPKPVDVGELLAVAASLVPNRLA